MKEPHPNMADLTDLPMPNIFLKGKLRAEYKDETPNKTKTSNLIKPYVTTTQQ